MPNDHKRVSATAFSISSSVLQAIHQRVSPASLRHLGNYGIRLLAIFSKNGIINQTAYFHVLPYAKQVTARLGDHMLELTAGKPSHGFMTSSGNSHDKWNYRASAITDALKCVTESECRRSFSQT